MESELALRYLPLFLVLAVNTYYEIRYGIIPNIQTSTAGIYFILLSFVDIPSEWWIYATGGVIVLIMLFYFNLMIETAFKNENIINGGGIKLLTVVGIALGIELSIPLIFISLILGIFTYFFSWTIFNKSSIPSSPIISISTIITLIYSVQN